LHARDLLDKQIADVLQLTPEAVSKIITRERRRLDVKGRATLVYLLCTPPKSD